MHSEKVRARFLCHVAKGSRCWLWTASTTARGYGQIAMKPGPGTTAHRLSWELFRGPIPNGLFVLHTCDNKRCVNPDHLFLGTAADNAADMRHKGRDRYNPLCRLSSDDDQEIVRLRENGMSQYAVAKLYGIDATSIRRAYKRATAVELY